MFVAYSEEVVVRDKVNALSILGMMYAYAGRWEEAFSFYGQAEQLAPIDAFLMRDISRLHLLRKNYEMAVAYGEDSILYDGKDIRTYLYLSQAYEGMLYNQESSKYAKEGLGLLEAIGNSFPNYKVLKKEFEKLL